MLLMPLLPLTVAPEEARTAISSEGVQALESRNDADEGGMLAGRLSGTDADDDGVPELDAGNVTVAGMPEDVADAVGAAPRSEGQTHFFFPLRLSTLYRLDGVGPGMEGSR